MLRFSLCLLPFSLFSHVFCASLPPYSGPYGVGLIDVEVPVSQPRNVTNTALKASGQPAFELQTVLFSLYYPTSKGASSSKPEHFWLPRPISLIADGIAHAYNIPLALILGALTTIAGPVTIPAPVDTDLLGGSEKFPVIVFSPGDGSLGTWYSHWNGEMASRGTIVAALQHRDGSTPATQVMIKGQPTKNLTALTIDDVDLNGNNTLFKLNQLQMRQAEFEETIKIVEQINNGSGSTIAQSNLRGEGQTLSGWKSRIDMGHLIVAGHSFGSNLALQVLNGAPNSAVPANGSINFDPGKDSGPLNTDVSVPIAILDSEEWSAVPQKFYGEQHFDVVKGIASSALEKNNASWFMTLVGTTHVSITDAPLITTSLLSFFTNFTSNSTLNPQAALADYVAVSNLFVEAVVNRTITGELAHKATYPEFDIIPDSTVRMDPWEIHVAPGSADATNGSSSGTSSGSGSSTPTKSGGDKLRVSLVRLLMYVAMMAVGVAVWMW